MEWFHVYPENDLKKHDLTWITCECEPVIHWEGIVVHNAWDMREIEEYLKAF